MYDAKILLSVAALAGTSLAQSPTSTDPVCLSSQMALADGAPTPAPALLSHLATALGNGPYTLPGHTTALPDTTFEDPDGYQELFCSIAAELPASLIPDFQSYGAGLLSYGSVHLSEYDAYITDCITTGEAASTLTSQLHAMLTGGPGLCQTTATPTPGGLPNGTYPTTPAPTGANSTAIPTSTTSLIPTAAAARPTGAVFGAAAIGGLLGAVALL